MAFSLSTLLDSMRLKRPSRRHIGCSQIGHPCDRKLWRDYHDPIAEEVDAQQRRIFRVGELHEILVKEELELLKDHLVIEKWQVPLKHLPLEGTADAILKINGGKRVLLEIKTMNDRSFKHFKTHGIYKSQLQYWIQCQAYMGMTRLPSAILLAANKNDQTLHHEVISYEESSFFSSLERAKRIKDAPLMPMGLTVLPKPDFKCTYCPYYTQCWTLKKEELK